MLPASCTFQPRTGPFPPSDLALTWANSRFCMPAQPTTMIRFQLLGTIDLRDQEGGELRDVLAQPKRLAILAYLVSAAPNAHHRRDTLLGVFWPELDQEHARNALSKAIHFLRRCMGETAIVSRSAEELAVDDRLIWADVRAFTAALDGDRLEEALELYRGDFLPSFFVADAPGFEEWLERERSRLRARAAKAAKLLAERHESGRNLTLAVTAARRAVELSDGDERSLRRLIELLDRLGDRAGAVRAYEGFARKLAAEFNVQPDTETVALIERVRASPPQRQVHVPEQCESEAAQPSADHFGEALAGRYLIERELGRGGMAIVYLAHDRKHDRPVALKTIRPELVPSLGSQRFLREIQIAARLQHPNILPLHDSGEVDGLLYYVMPYVEGESLRHRLDREGQLQVEDALRIARQVAEALAYAHSLGVVHRDIKPENVLLSGEHALVADFGIARAITEAGGDRLTETGLAIGTAAYMSPEQASADPRLDGRSDIYSLGCVVYEMLAGQPPFTGPSAQAVAARHMVDPVPPLRTVRKSVSPAVEQSLLRALEKNPADRFRTAGQFAQALDNPDLVHQSFKARVVAYIQHLDRRTLASAAVVTLIAAASLPGVREIVSRGPAAMASMAVLPLENLTGDSSKAYLADGLTADLIDELARVKGLRVPSSPTVARYRGNRPELSQVARELGVSAVVTGNVREVSGRPRVALQLVDANDGFVRWTTVYDPRDPAAVPDIGAVLAESLRVQLLPRSKSPATRGARDAESYRLYLRGRYLVNQVQRDRVREGIEALEQAVARDSGFTDAWAALPLAYTLLGQLGGLTPTESQVLQRRAVERAIALDSLNGEAYSARAHLRVQYEWDYAGADHDYRRAIELTPGSALNHMRYSQFLGVVGLDDSSLAVMRRGMALDPTASWLIANHSYALLKVGRAREALAEAERALSHDSNQWVAYHLRAWSYKALGQPDRTLQDLERALQIVRDTVPFLLGPIGEQLALQGHRERAQKVLTRLERFDPAEDVWNSRVRLALGDRAGALDALERSARNREASLGEMLSSGNFEALRGEPRYEAVLRRVGIEKVRTRL